MQFKFKTIMSQDALVGPATKFLINNQFAEHMIDFVSQQQAD